jgi:ABC-type branched-subunit amino acid transport system substrate-binding protein
VSLIPSHTHDLQLKYHKGGNKVYEVYEKPQQANYFNKLFKSQLIKQQFKHIKLQVNIASWSTRFHLLFELPPLNFRIHMSQIS